MKYTTMTVCVLQLLAARLAVSLSWPYFLALAYVVGGSLTANLVLAMHELAHYNMFKSPAANRLFAVLVANAPVGIPAAVSFRRYHLEHHRYQGEDMVDVDVPTKWETEVFRGPARKMLWMALQPAFYSLRPMFVAPKKPSSLELFNVAYQIAFDVSVVTILGPRALAYMLLSVLLGMGLHPCAYHFVSEHYVTVEGHETYSYYGWINLLEYNVGYHNEHHDFPNIPGSRLPALRKLAPEFYESLPHYDSWWTVFYLYIFSDDITPGSRVKRATLDEAGRISLLEKDAAGSAAVFFSALACGTFAAIWSGLR